MRSEHFAHIKDNDGRMVTDDTEKATVLNTFLSSVFTQEKEGYTHHSIVNKTSQDVTLWLKAAGVKEKLDELNTNKSPGPDGLHLRVLKELSQVKARPIFLIFVDSILTGLVPADWRKANVVPIFKKGQRHIPENYRPVSLTSIVGKFYWRG